MDWFLYEIGLRHERVNESYQRVKKKESKENHIFLVIALLLMK